MSATVSQLAMIDHDHLLAIQLKIDANYAATTAAALLSPAEAKPRFEKIARELDELFRQNKGNWIEKGLKGLGESGLETASKLEKVRVAVAPYSQQLEAASKAAAVALSPPSSGRSLIEALGAPLNGSAAAPGLPPLSLSVAKWVEKEVFSYGKCRAIANFDGIAIPVNKITLNGYQTFAVISYHLGKVKRIYPFKSKIEAQVMVEKHWRQELARTKMLLNKSNKPTKTGKDPLPSHSFSMMNGVSKREE
jgi:hypothetical protein